ncbi:hypothetical protein [Pseudomonas sp.]|uniref:hypothetical protein n=1 Tax=Pseudomonas sp. TaxID=306 RepID=UPI00258383A7|nr:hypothetical protein [Pseudomonas sp.]
MLKQIRASAIAPALALLPAKMSGRRAEQMLLTIGLQESRFEHRRQLGNGPARGLWQFERGGGVRGVLEFPSTKALARSVCEARGVAPAVDAVHAALERDDVLAAAFGRLLLWTDPAPLPALGEPQQAWDLYVRTWRPGKPHRHTWDDFYAQAVEELA